jgi:hypothetical protein
MRLTEQIVSLGHEVVFCTTSTGCAVCSHELGFDLPTGNAEAAAVALATFLERPTPRGFQVAMPTTCSIRSRAVRIRLMP